MSISQVLEITATLIILYLVLTNANHFASVVSAISQGYTSSVKALQGR